MIDDLDRSLRRLLEQEFGAPLPFELSFAPPDKDFKPVSQLRPTVNCYLYEIAEQRALRDPGPTLERRPGGEYVHTPAPFRLRACYCITAWSPGDPASGADPHLDEHQLLAALLALLLRHAEFPRTALVGALLAQTLPLPTQVGQREPGSNPGDFWHALGGRLRPALDYSVTLALAYQAPQQGPLATAVLARFGQRLAQAERLAGGADAWQAAGGTVWRRGDGAPLAGAWLRLDENGALAVADAEGRYVFPGLAAGSYTVRVRVPGYQEASQAITVPAAGAAYDLYLDPL